MSGRRFEKWCRGKTHSEPTKLPLSSFRLRKNSKDQYYHICKSCMDYREPFSRILRYGRQYHLYVGAKRRAKERNLSFDIEPDDIQIPTVCPILGMSLDTKGENNKIKDDTPTLDRKNNNGGYTKDNIMVMSHKANRMKNNANLEELVAMGEWARNQLELYNTPTSKSETDEYNPEGPSFKGHRRRGRRDCNVVTRRLVEGT